MKSYIHILVKPKRQLCSDDKEIINNLDCQFNTWASWAVLIQAITFAVSSSEIEEIQCNTWTQQWRQRRLQQLEYYIRYMMTQLQDYTSLHCSTEQMYIPACVSILEVYGASSLLIHSHQCRKLLVFACWFCKVWLFCIEPLLWCSRLNRHSHP